MADDNGGEALESARARRATLKSALSAVEVAAAAPAAQAEWRPELADALAVLRGAFDDHVRDVEDPGGLLDVLREEAPHLSNQVTSVRDEHPALEKQIDDVIAMVGDGAPEEIRDAVLETLLALARHRQNGADLVYQAYSVDIGGGE